MAVAVLGKLDTWSTWSSAVASFVGRRGSGVVRVGLPVLEGSVAAVALLDPKLGLLAAGATLAIFAVVVLLLRRKHAGTACNCFGGVADSEIGGSLAIRDAALAATAVGVAVAARGVSVRPLSAPSVLLAVVVGLLLVVFTQYRALLAVDRRSHAQAEQSEGTA